MIKRINLILLEKQEERSHSECLATVSSVACHKRRRRNPVRKRWNLYVVFFLPPIVFTEPHGIPHCSTRLTVLRPIEGRGVRNDNVY